MDDLDATRLALSGNAENVLRHTTLPKGGLFGIDTRQKHHT